MCTFFVAQSYVQSLRQHLDTTSLSSSSKMHLLTSSLLSLLSLVSLTTAQPPSGVGQGRPTFNNPSSNSSSGNAVLVYQNTAVSNTQFTFALNADKSTGDLYFHLSSSGGNGWIGVGIGGEMKGALMFMAYPSSDKTGVTISPRIADGNSEPTYQSNIQIQDKGTDTATGNRENLDIVAEGVCRNCTSWMDSNGIGQSLDLTTKDQPFIFAVGPVFPPVDSDSRSASLSEHALYGRFTVDMAAATSNSGGSIPSGPFTSNSNASPAFDVRTDSDPASHIHGLVMCLVFILLLPLSSLLLRVWNKVRGHWITNTVALVLFCMAVAGGSVVSTKYNKSKSFTSAHQVIGILLLLAMLSQWVLGFLNHRIFKRENRGTIMGKIHKFLGPGIIFFGLVNGAVGIAFAGTYLPPHQPLPLKPFHH